MLSGLMSQCKTLQFFRCFRAMKSCFEYALTAVSLSPILRPNFFNTSRRFILRDSKTKQRWFRYMKLEINRTQWRLSSRSALASFSSIETSCLPALYLYNHIGIKWSFPFRYQKFHWKNHIQETINLHCFIVPYNFNSNFFRVIFPSFKIFCPHDC